MKTLPVITVAFLTLAASSALASTQWILYNLANDTCTNTDIFRRFTPSLVSPMAFSNFLRKNHPNQYGGYTTTHMGNGAIEVSVHWRQATLRYFSTMHTCKLYAFFREQDMKNRKKSK